MVKENGRQNRFIRTECHFGPEIGGLMSKEIFQYFMYLVNIFWPLRGGGQKRA